MIPPGFFGFIIPFNQYAKKSVTLLTKGLEPDCEGKIELTGSKNSQSTSLKLRYSWVNYTVVPEKLNKAGLVMAQTLRPFQNERITLLRKATQSAKELTDSKGILCWIVSEKY